MFMTNPKNAQHVHCNNPYTFDYGVIPVAHLLLLTTFKGCQFVRNNSSLLLIILATTQSSSSSPPSSTTTTTQRPTDVKLINVVAHFAAVNTPTLAPRSTHTNASFALSSSAFYPQQLPPTSSKQHLINFLHHLRNNNNKLNSFLVPCSVIRWLD